MSDNTGDSPPSLDELFNIISDYAVGGPFREKFISPSGLGSLNDWPMGTSSWCWIKAEILFYQVLPSHIRDKYKTQKSINEALEMLYDRLLTHWPAYIGTDYTNSDGECEDVERDGPNLVHTVPNTPDGSENGAIADEEDMGKQN